LTRDVLADNGDLTRRVDLDPQHAIDFLHRAGGGDRLAFEMLGRVGDAGVRQARGPLVGDDNRDVLLVSEVLLGVEVNLTALSPAGPWPLSPPS
jgi:hypothetical protein